MEIRDIDLKELIVRETGRKFNRKNKILSPFSNEKTASFAVYFDSNNNKEKFKDFSTGKNGDCIDFIMELKGMSYDEARKYLGIDIEKTPAEILGEKIKNRIDWELTRHRKGQKLLGIFPFVGDKNEIMYFKAKFKNEDGKKALSYYHIENDEVINKRGTDEIPYNLYNVIKGIEAGKTIIITEGEADSNKLNSVLRNNSYVATSVKGCKDLSVLEGAKIYVCGDTGKAGEEYKQYIRNKLFNQAEEFKLINLPGIEELEDNSDVSDWLEAGHTKKDLLNAFRRSLDLKSKYELQQDFNGIYKTKEGEKRYLTDFKIIRASNIKFVDESSEGVKLVLESSLGSVIERTAGITVFDDLKSFKNFLHSFDLTFKGVSSDINTLKTWIRKYFALKDEIVHTGTRFVVDNNEISLVTNNGALKNDVMDTHVNADGGAKVNILDVESITKEELQELREYLFNFAALEKSYSIIGTIVNNLVVAQAMKLNVKLHHLLIVGESGSGKSTILENVIAPILNYPKDDMKSIGEITRFAFIKNLSEGNYPILFEEHKPSRMRESQILMISEILRNLYDRHSIDRGNRNLVNKKFPLIRPIIIAGEERYSNSEKALYERSCIVYLSKNLRTKEHTHAMEWILEHEDLLNKLGKSIIDQVLNLSVEEYEKIRKDVVTRIKGLKDRPLNTTINICSGIEILNKVFTSFGIEKVENYENLVVKNIINEIVDNQNAAGTEVEEILMFFNEMLEDDRVFRVNDIVRVIDKTVCIRTNEMFNQILEHIKRIGLKKQILEVKDFKKQAKLAGYILKLSARVLRVDSKSTKFDVYDTCKLKTLGVDEIVPPDIQEIDIEEGGQQEMFNNVTILKTNKR